MAKFNYKSLHRELFGNAVKEKFRVPEFHCESCIHCKDNICLLFKRFVVKDYNRCINHSNYEIFSPVFKTIERLKKSVG